MNRKKTAKDIKQIKNKGEIETIKKPFYSGYFE